MIGIRRLVVVIVSIVFLFSACNTYDNQENTDSSYSENPHEYAEKFAKEYEQIMSQAAIDEKERIIEQIGLLSKTWIIDEALFGNRLINVPSEENLGIVFNLGDDFDIFFDGEVYRIINIDIIHEENLYREYSFSSGDVRSYNDLTVLVLDTAENESYEKIHIMFDKELQSIYCFVHKNELVTGFYKATLLN